MLVGKSRYKDKDYPKKYYLAHKSEILEKKKAYKALHREEIALKSKLYREKNKAKLLDYYSHWYKDRGLHRKKLPYESRWEVVNRDKARVGKKVRYAVKTGKLVKPDCCQRCNRKTSVHAHHEDYAKIYAVTWLCESCHRIVHVEKARRISGTT